MDCGGEYDKREERKSESMGFGMSFIEIIESGKIH